VIQTQNSIDELNRLDKKHFIHPTSSLKEQQEKGPAIIFQKGEGVFLTDVNGKKYLEGMSSLWNVNIGYGRKELAEAAKQQMEQLAYSSCFATFSNEPAIRLAEKVAELTPGDLSGVFFTSGGSESNDTAYKLVRNYWKLKGQPQKNKIISRNAAYHGVALGSTSATGIEVFQNFTTVKAPGFIHIEPLSTDALKEAIAKEGADTIAAFIAEPIQGAGGVITPPEGYFEEVRRICDEHDILFIADEVITGFGRTGKMFACEHWGVVPDVMLIAKGITSGYQPLGAVVFREKIHQELIDLTEGVLLHGFTYSGHATACAVALKNIEIIQKEELVENSRKMGTYLLEGLKNLEQEIDIVSDVRGLGLIAGIEIVRNKQTKERFEVKMSQRIIEEARSRGLILRNVVFGDMDTIVFCPPLIINKGEIDELLSILRSSILEAKRQYEK